jgi:hypothetical protein
VTTLEEDLKILENKIGQLKLAYERYFLGTRPREPARERAEVEKIVTLFTNAPIQNTALRFRFGSLCSRYHAFKRQWNETLRKIEQGTYSRHRFKADLQATARPEASAATPPTAGARADSSDLFNAYVEARQSCGQSVAKLSPQRLKATLAKQEAALRERYGKSEFRFKVVVENGKAKVKASRVA